MESVKNSPLLPYILKNTLKTAKILEADCGMGQWVIYLANLGYDITGIDFSEPIIKKLKAEYSNLKFLVGDVTNFEFEGESFDAILSWGVLEHFEAGPNQALSEAYRILGEKGIFYITVPCKNNLYMLLSPFLYIHDKIRENKYIRKILKKKNVDKRFHKYDFKRKIFKRYILKTGFEIKEMKPISHEIGFAKVINRLFQIVLKNPKIFCKNKTGKWDGLTKNGNILCNILKKISPWLTPDQIFIVAEK